METKDLIFFAMAILASQIWSSSAMENNTSKLFFAVFWAIFAITVVIIRV